MIAPSRRRHGALKASRYPVRWDERELAKRLGACLAGGTGTRHAHCVEGVVQLTVMRVPALGALSTVSVAPMLAIRSRIMLSPRWSAVTADGSKPRPSSA